MTDQYSWKPLQKILAVFLIFLSIYIQVKNNEFKDKYEVYINGTNQITASSPSIIVEYSYRDRVGRLRDSFYLVPTLSSTPEWYNIQFLKLIFFATLPFAVPRKLKQ